MENKPKNYLNDEHLSIGTREYLRVLNAGGRPVESLPVAEARKVLALSLIHISEPTRP